jgi:predicted dehydrogenase
MTAGSITPASDGNTKVLSVGEHTEGEATILAALLSTEPLPMEAVRIAVVGAGYWGPNLIRNFRTSPLTDLRWVVDLERDRAQAAIPAQTDIRITDSLAEMLADETVEAVAVATPPGTHQDIVFECIAAGKHILVEKPLASTVSEGRAIVEAAEAAGITIMTDHTFCYTESVRRIRDIIASGEIGDFLYFDSVRINLGLIQSEVDVFWDLAPHDISILDFIVPAGVVIDTVAAQASDPLGVGHACVGYLFAELSNGATAHAHLNWLSPTKIRRVIIGGSQKMLVWDDLHPAQRVSIYDSGIELTSDPSERARLLVSYRVGDMLAPAFREVEALRRVVDEFAASIREDRPPLTDGDAGLRVLEVLEAVGKSLDSDGVSVNVSSLVPE